MGQNPKPENDRQRIEVQVAYCRRLGRHSLADAMERMLAGAVDKPSESEQQVRNHERTLVADLLEENVEKLGAFRVTGEQLVMFIALVIRLGAVEVPAFHSWSGHAVTHGGVSMWQTECRCGEKWVLPSEQAVEAAKAHVAKANRLLLEGVLSA